MRSLLAWGGGSSGELPSVFLTLGETYKIADHPKIDSWEQTSLFNSSLGNR